MKSIKAGGNVRVVVIMVEILEVVKIQKLTG